MRYVPPSSEIDIVTVCAFLLGAMVLFLLWRHRQQRLAIASLRFKLCQDRERHELTEQALTDARKQICRLNGSQQSLRDADRRRIARDLHDDLGQHLLALDMNAVALAQRHPELAQALAPLHDRVQQAARALRAIVRDLPPQALESGLEDALQEQVAQFSRLSGIPCRLESEPATFPTQPDGALATAVYRVLQESLSNIVRHAQASEVCVGICRQQHSLSLTVRDNGIGLPQPPASRGSGLRGIAQRVADAGGCFNIASTPGCGTALTMSFPIQ